MPARRSTTPFAPNDMIDFPVFASTSWSRLFMGKMILWSRPSELSQYIAPRVAMPFMFSRIQISFPVLALTATSEPFRPRP
jgi:hypothetical protein